MDSLDAPDGSLQVFSAAFALFFGLLEVLYWMIFLHSVSCVALLLHIIYSMIMEKRQSDKETTRQRQMRHRDRQRQTETKRDKQRQKETTRDKKTERLKD